MSCIRVVERILFEKTVVCGWDGTRCSCNCFCCAYFRGKKAMPLWPNLCRLTLRKNFLIALLHAPLLLITKKKWEAIFFTFMQDDRKEFERALGKKRKNFAIQQLEGPITAFHFFLESASIGKILAFLLLESHAKRKLQHWARWSCNNELIDPFVKMISTRGSNTCITAIKVLRAKAIFVKLNAFVLSIITLGDHIAGAGWRYCAFCWRDGHLPFLLRNLLRTNEASETLQPAIHYSKPNGLITGP